MPQASLLIPNQFQSWDIEGVNDIVIFMGVQMRTRMRSSRPSTGAVCACRRCVIVLLER